MYIALTLCALLLSEVLYVDGKGGRGGGGRGGGSRGGGRSGGSRGGSRGRSGGGGGGFYFFGGSSSGGAYGSHYGSSSGGGGSCGDDCMVVVWIFVFFLILLVIMCILTEGCKESEPNTWESVRGTDSKRNQYSPPARYPENPSNMERGERYVPIHTPSLGSPSSPPPYAEDDSQYVPSDLYPEKKGSSFADVVEEAQKKDLEDQEEDYRPAPSAPLVGPHERDASLDDTLEQWKAHVAKQQSS